MKIKKKPLLTAIALILLQLSTAKFSRFLVNTRPASLCGVVPTSVAFAPKTLFPFFSQTAEKMGLNGLWT